MKLALTSSIRKFNSGSGSIIKFCLGLVFTLLCQISHTPLAQAEPLPTELIPPDVTLSPKAGASSGSSSRGASGSQSANAPGLSSGSPASQAESLGRARYGGSTKLPATGLNANAGSNPQPPPVGSGNMFSGLQTSAGQNPAPNTNTNSENNTNDPVCVIDTDKGRIVIRLFQKYAPKTVEAFISMINEGFYNGLTFHRYEPGFVIQGGCPKGNGTGMYIDPKTNQPRMLFLESSQNVRHNTAGVVAMAHFPKNPHSASCQFYITLKACANLDHKYTIFGGVVEGLDVVFNIRKGDKINSITMQN